MRCPSTSGPGGIAARRLRSGTRSPWCHRPLRTTAATLGESSDAIEPTLERLLSALTRRLASPVSEVLDAWRARDALRGRTIAWNTHGPEDGPGHGQAEGIDAAGRLIVALPGGGRTALEAGEVHLAIE